MPGWWAVTLGSAIGLPEFVTPPVASFATASGVVFPDEGDEGLPFKEGPSDGLPGWASPCTGSVEDAAAFELGLL
jgi:hypothetical protein